MWCVIYDVSWIWNVKASANVCTCVAMFVWVGGLSVYDAD